MIEPSPLLIGIGASAADGEALQATLRHLPVSAPLSFVCVQPFEFESKFSLLHALGSEHPLIVEVLESGTAIVAGRLYLPPPRALVHLYQERLYLTAVSSSARTHKPVDHLFRSLAQQRRHRSVGVLLAGTGSDGTQGLDAITAAGGLTIAPSSASAAGNGVAHTATVRGVVDRALTLEQIAGELVRFDARMQKMRGPWRQLPLSTRRSLGASREDPAPQAGSLSVHSREPDLSSLMQRVTAEQFMPQTAVVDEHGRIQCASERLGRYLVVEQDPSIAPEAMGNNLFDLCREGMRSGIRSALDSAIEQQRRVSQCDLEVRLHDGSLQRVALHVQPLEETAGNSRLYLLVFQDAGPAPERAADEGIRAPSEQRQSEQFLRRVLNSLFNFAAVCTPDGILVEVNRAALEAGNLDAKQVIGKPFADAPWWSYDASVQETLRAAIRRAADGQMSRYDVAIRVADNQYMTIDFQIVPMRDAQGKVTHLIPSAIDITQRLRDQERLTVLGTMAEQSHDFIGIADLSGQGIFLNAAGRRLVGLEPEAPIEQWNVRQFFAKPDFPAVAETVRLAIAEGQCAKAVQFRHLKSGEGIDVYWDVFRIDDPATGTPFALGTITQDIRQRKEDERRMIEAREKADAANRSKSEFLANMSHEIRTPMTAILGFADLLSEQLQRSEDAALIATIQDNGRLLLQIINDILDLSKIESGKLQIALSDCSPQALIEEVRSLMNVRAVDKHLQLSSQVASNVPQTIRSDPLRLKQILINLVGNAIKFTDRGRVTLQAIYNPETSQLRFSVTDTGIGISEESQRMLFEPFTQVDGSDTRSIGGTGLGLAISRRLAERLGGQLVVDSELNVGSTFSLLLNVEPPAIQLSDAAVLAMRPEPAQQSLPELAQASQSLPRRLDCRVLVVDDRPEIRFLADRILHAAGAEVVTAARARAAIDLIQQSQAAQRPFDVVLTDIQMPEMDGYEMAQELRAGGFEQPIIAVTAHARQVDLDRCIAAGCNAYASKPLDRRKLIELIAQYTE